MMNDSRIKILIADDHMVVREGLRRILEANPRVRVIGEVSDGSELEEAVYMLKPDVTLVDIKMPKRGGIEVIERLLSQDVSTRFIVLTAYEEEDYMLQALRAGVSGYMLKDVDDEVLNRAIESVAHGEMVLDPRVAKTVRDGAERGLPNSKIEKFGLTPRERDVLELLAKGLSNQEIAQRLFISLNTLKFHIKNIYGKMQVCNRREALKLLHEVS